MDIELTVFEAYLPDAAGRDGQWSQQLVDEVDRTIAAHHLKAILLILPADETAFWLISPCEPTTDRSGIPAELDLAGLIGATTALAGGRVVARRMDGHLVQPEPAED